MWYGRGVEPLNSHHFVVVHLHDADPDFRTNLDFGTNRQPRLLAILSFQLVLQRRHVGTCSGVTAVCGKLSHSFLDLAAEVVLLSAPQPYAMLTHTFGAFGWI